MGANKILVVGPSGTGKSRSALNLNPEETFIVGADKKALPIKG
jgi:serine kinase of HPr protein (carbohydrate metabolism regulator)